MKVLSFAGSLRRDSRNKALAREVVRLLDESSAARAAYLDLRDYPMPVYDGDLEHAAGVPSTVMRLSGKVAEADALIIATPEYNGGISGVLKNAVDWVSRVKPVPVAGKHLLLLSASPGAWGGIRGLWHSRVPFETLGVHVFPQMMSLPAAGSAFDDAGHLDGDRARQLRNLLDAFTRHVAAHVAFARGATER